MSRSVARLFEQFQPEHYDLRFDLDREAMTFSGTVTVRGRKAGRPSERITFHQKELKITSATITKHDKKGDQALAVKRINNQESYDEVRLHAESMIYPGEYTVTMAFEGVITRDMHGIYPCFFTHDGQNKKLITTQFESHHAREAFPCIDEPEAKATFDLTLTTPAGETVLANTPIRTQTTHGKLLQTTFETTPRMSSYLLAFVYGEIEAKESKTKTGVAVHSYATPDNAGLTGYSVDVAVRALEFFEDYFGVPYPLPKVDLVALPDFTVGAMENWGLITFREQALLIDPQSSGIESKQLVALVVSHELSHQWFGNLVTMQWWDDLWLNESFANMMEYRAVDAIEPDWHIWEQFVSHETVSAKRRDSLANVQTIRSEVRHPDEINTLFDPSIVYAKGGSVLHMLLNYIGEEAFRAGLQAYFKKHAYGNTRAEDLWATLSGSSHHNINDFMTGWLTRPGYPLVTVDWQPGDKQLQLSQRRFLSDPQAAADVSEPWHVPLASTAALSENVLSKSVAHLTVQDPAGGPLLLNHDGHSYFLPHYRQPEHLRQIVTAVKQHQVNIIDRFLLLDTYNMLQIGGVSATTELLDLLSAYAGEDSETVWGALAMAIGEARRLIEGDEVSENRLDALIRKLVLKLAGELGWDDQPADSAQTLRLRGLAIAIAASAKDPAIIKEGLRRFAAFKKPGDLPASTRAVVYSIAARHGSDADFKKLLILHETLISAEEKEEVASGLTAAREPLRYERLLALLTTDSIRRQDLLHWYAWLIRNRHSRAAAWQWMVDHWDWIVQEFGGDKNYDYFPRFAGSIFSRPEDLKRFKAFFDDKKSAVALELSVTLAEQEISSRIAWRKRNEVAVKAWLKKH